MAWICPKGCEPSVFHAVVFPRDVGKPLLITQTGVLVNPDGTATNRFFDGTVGVSEELKEAAEESELVICIECGERAEWEE